MKKYLNFIDMDFANNVSMQAEVFGMHTPSHEQMAAGTGKEHLHMIAQEVPLNFAEQPAVDTQAITPLQPKLENPAIVEIADKKNFVFTDRMLFHTLIVTSAFLVVVTLASMAYHKK